MYGEQQTAKEKYEKMAKEQEDSGKQEKIETMEEVVKIKDEQIKALEELSENLMEQLDEISNKVYTSASTQTFASSAVKYTQTQVKLKSDGVQTEQQVT